MYFFLHNHLFDACIIKIVYGNILYKIEGVTEQEKMTNRDVIDYARHLKRVKNQALEQMVESMLLKLTTRYNVVSWSFWCVLSSMYVIA